MRLLKVILIFFVLVALQIATAQWLNVPPSVEARMTALRLGGEVPAEGVSGQAFSDDFNRSDGDSLGANWTEFGDADISSNAMILVSGGWTNCGGIYNTATDTVSQYVKAFVQHYGDGGYSNIILRYVDASNPHYTIQFSNDGTIAWNSYTTRLSGEAEIQSAGSGAFDADNGDDIGVTITGTDTDTVVRIWVNPTGLPSAADNWDGDTSPSFTFSNNPATVANTGKYVGFGGNTSSANPWARCDNFFGGDIP